VSATSFYAVTLGDIPIPHGRERFYVIAILKSFPPDPSCPFGTEKANSNNECYAFDLMIKLRGSFSRENRRLLL
jgi:hypothetical protein